MDLALEMDPTAEKALYTRALLLTLAGLWAEARGDLITLLTHHPDNVQAQALLESVQRSLEGGLT